MKLICSSCGRSARPTPEQADSAGHAAAQGFEQIPVGCPDCRKFTVHAVEPEDDDRRPSRAPGLSFRCPVAGCTGWLAYVESRGNAGAHHRCARCHSMWFSADALDAEIGKIIELFPYRQAVVRRASGRFVPLSVLDMPDDYENRVREEPDGRTRTRVRG